MPPIRSDVWKHFSKESSTDVRCKLCCKTLKCSNNTTNMMQHLKLKHSKEAEALKRNNEALYEASCVTEDSNELPSTSQKPTPRSNQPNINTVFSNVESFASGGTKHQKLTQSIVEMVVMDNLPFSHVEGKGFLQLMKHQYPLYKVPTRNTIKAEIEKMYNREVEKFKKMLSHVSNICLTTDIWTDTQMNSMLGVTVHGLFESKQFYGTIGVFKLTEAHTAAHISEVLKGSLSEFSINKSNVIAVVTDNGANIVKSIYNTFGKNHHIPCFAHTLNLICDSSLNTPEVSDIITSCRAIVTWFKRHVKANDNLRQLQISAGIPEGKQLKLILDVKTRWNSTYYMLARLIQLIQYVSQILISFSDAPPMITTKNKEEVIEMIGLLRPLEAMTTQISGEKYATLSQVIPLAHCGRQQIMKISCTSVAADKLKTNILKQFDRRFGEMEHSFLLAASTLLDPRFKKIHFQNPIALSTVMRHIRREMAEIEHMEDSIGSGSETSSAGDTEFDLWAPHKSLAHKRKRNENDLTQPQDELSYFLNSPVLELKRDVVTAWDEMSSVYPKLYSLSQKYCFLIGTSVPSERLFSKAGATATEKRNRLTTKRLSKLLFLNSILNK